MDIEVYQKIVKKKEFSNLPKRDVEMIYSLFDKKDKLEEEKIKLTRDLLRKVYVAFSTTKVLNPKILEKKSVDEILNKHISTKERFPYYGELYLLLLKDSGVVIDLGAGINGLSYSYFPKKVKYLGVEAVGQMVLLMNKYFEKEKISGKAIHETLFNLENIKKLIKREKGKKVVFLFKALDSLEMVKKNYSKKLLKEIVPLVDRVVVSFATSSLVKKEKFKVRRYWFFNFVKENFKIIDDFYLGNERYVVISKKKS
jgi:hypothetical protein